MGVPSLRRLPSLGGRARFAVVSAIPIALLGVLFVVWQQGAERERPIAGR